MLSLLTTGTGSMASCLTGMGSNINILINSTCAGVVQDSKHKKKVRECFKDYETAVTIVLDINRAHQIFYKYSNKTQNKLYKGVSVLSLYKGGAEGRQA